MKPALDRAAKVRKGEELDAAKLEAFLCAAVPGLESPFEILQFPRGYSNLTYLVRAGKRELVLRRPPVGSEVETAHDMGREYRILTALAGRYHKAPAPLAFCSDPDVLGAPFYVMERASGVILRRELPRGVELGPESAARLARRFAHEMARLHAIDWRQAGLGDLGRPEGYVERQVAGWRRRDEASRGEPVPEMDEVGAWLEANRPAESGAALIHNDFKYDNLVLEPEDPSRIVAVLDWEMATVGDPLMDLGTTLGYWVEAGDPEALRRLKFCPTDLPGSPTRSELAALYAEASHREVADLPFYYAYGLYKIAVIAQQIHYRYLKGLTADERFAGLGEAVRALARAAAETVGRA